MKLKYLTAIALTAMALNSCDEDTGTIGSSLTGDNDNLLVSASEYDVLTRSFVPDSVYSYNEECYLGKIVDPETGTMVTSNFMFQFNMMENKHLPTEDKILGRDNNGKVVADSCHILLFYNRNHSFGDTLAAMKIKVSELEKPVEDGIHYTSFNPAESGYLRDNGLKKYQTFVMHDMTNTDSLYTLYPYLRVCLNDAYTDKDGVTYNNYGTYILRKYYEHPEFFKNSYAFVHNVCPGFYFEVADGEGYMAKFEDISLRVFYHYQNDDKTYNSYLAAASTQEVLQTITVENDKEALNRLAADEGCTYMKTPAGIFTEVTLPVDEIKTSHDSDSLLSASVAFNRLNNQQSLSDYTFKAPQKVMLIQKDSLNSFFENTRNYNNLYAFYTTLSKNAYSFTSSSDISNMVVRMYHAKQQGLKSDPAWVEKHPNWNKALLIPVQTITSSSSTTTSTATPIALVNEMGMTSTRLVRGTADSPIKIKIIYAKFND